MIAYRPYFLIAACQLLLAMGIWFYWLLGRGWGIPLPDGLPPAWWHAGALLYGVFPLFVMGFTLTATPNWLGENPVPPRRYGPALALMTIGAFLAQLSFFLGRNTAIWGWAFHGLGWAWATGTVYGVVRESRHPGKRHFYLAIAVIVAGLIGEGLYGASLLWLSAPLATAAREAALWLFLLPTFFSISHRMVPFFTRLAVGGRLLPQPMWLLPAFTLACWGRFFAFFAEAPIILALCDALLFAMAFGLIVAWRCLHQIGHPLVGVHHLAMLWLPVAMAFYGFQDLVGGVGWAPLHALTVGYFGTMLLGMSARVVIAHGGGPLVFPAGLRTTFALFQLSPLMRLFAESPLASFALSSALQAMAAAVWLGAWLSWVGFLSPWLGVKSK
ncbi:MAG: NnrS family protein [Rhodocyclaceae bacterium]|nr:NnrS family protein [Rhodocyclaceae bacterium]